jgi:hypothetical protein
MPETPYHALQPSQLQMRLERRRSLKMSMLGGHRYAVVQFVFTE